jgi:N6-adenosine-specific RNA methylase IME4
MKYQIIYADPPWSYDDKLGTNSAKMGGYDKYYKGMSLPDICDLPINELADKDCILFLWATMPKLQEAFKVIDSWGFKHKTTAFTWIKLNPKSETIFKGVGRWVMGNAELVLLATKGKPKRIAKNISQVVMAKRGKHSVKPNEVKDRIVALMGDLPRIELFARQKTDGWDVWGNEVESDIKL